MKRILTLWHVFLLCITAHATTTKSGDCPPWVNGDYPPKSNNTYYFMMTEGSGATLPEAEKDADFVLVNALMRASGVTIAGNQIEQIFAKTENGVYNEATNTEYNYDFQFDNVHIAFKIVDRYWTKKGGKYDCKVLYEVAHNPANVRYETIEYTTKYGARGLWRSAIIPGWGQMYKRSYVKGTAFLAVEAAIIAGACIYNNQNKSYNQKATASFDPNAIKFYQNKANDARNIRNGLIIGGAAVYVYNLIDAIVANGKLRYKNTKGKQFALSPWISADSSMGMSLTYNF